MSMFNMAAGYDPMAPVVLMLLGIAPADVPRFRDAYISPETDGPILCVLTRTGGGNRDTYEKDRANEEALSSHGGPWNDDLREIEGYLADRDDDFDSTFAHFMYRCPDHARKSVEEMITQAREEGWDFPKPMDRFKSALASL